MSLAAAPVVHLEEHIPLEPINEGLPAQEGSHLPAAQVPNHWYSFFTTIRFWCITLIGFLGTANLFIIRANLSIALPCMVYLNVSGSDRINENGTIISTLPPGCVRIPPPQNITSEILNPYVWSSSTRGLVNGFFFIGYFFSQVPAAFLANRFGGRKVMTILIGLSILSNVLQHPLALLLGRDKAYLAFIILRFLNGIGSGCFFGIYPGIMSNWLPKSESSRTISIAFSGLYVGIIAAWALGGYSCEMWGWPTIFYSSGIICTAWLVLFLVFVTDKPETHWLISESERMYILANRRQGPPPPRQESLAREENNRSWCLRVVHSMIPSAHDWRVFCAIITSPCVWAQWIASVAYDYGDFTFLTNIPSYMDEVLYFDLRHNGLLSAKPYFVLFLAVIMLGWFFDTILENDILRSMACFARFTVDQRRDYLRVIVRKFANTVGMIGPAIAVCLLTFADCTRPVMAVVILGCGVVFQAFSFSGYDANYFDFGGRYSGRLYAVGNTFAATTGFVSPYLVAVMTPNHTHAEWTLAFYVAALVLISGGLFFLIFAKSKEQNWEPDEQAHPVQNGNANHQEHQDNAEVAAPV